MKLDLKNLRYHLGITQQEMANILGRSRYSYILKEKDGTVTMQEYVLIAARFPDAVYKPDDYYEYTPNAIRDNMELNGVKQEEIAKALGVTQANISIKLAKSENLYDYKDKLDPLFPQKAEIIMQMKDSNEIECAAFTNNCSACKYCCIDVKNGQVLCKNKEQPETYLKRIEDIELKDNKCEKIDVFPALWTYVSKRGK